MKNLKVFYGMLCIGMDTIAIFQYNKVNLSKVKKNAGR